MQHGELVRSTSGFSVDSAQDGSISHLLSFVPDTERYAFPTLFALPEDDIESIWSNISSFIERQMLLQKGVYIAGLGTFTFSVQRMDVGRQHKLIQRPIFLLAERFKHSSGLKQTRDLQPAGEVPVVPLNLSALSVDSLFERDVVERCVRESLMLLTRAVAKRPFVLLSFHSVGMLSFRRYRVRMRFHQDFLTALHSRWSLDCDNSNNSRVSNDVVSAGAGHNGCSPHSDHEQPQVQTSHSSLDARDHSSSSSSSSSSSEFKKQEEDEGGEKADHHICPSNKRETLRPATVSGICLTEDLEVPPQVQTGNRLLQGGDREVKEKDQEKCEGYHHMDQKLCKICKERAQRNELAQCVSEEERRWVKDQDEVDRLYLINQQLVDEELHLREEANQEMSRRRHERDAKWNMDMAEAKESEAQRCSKYHGSYIFRARPRTPPQQPRQRQYLQQLLGQVQDRQQVQAWDQQAQSLIERMDRIGLADEISVQRQQELLRKASVVKCYRRALNTQCEGRSKGLGGTTRLEGSVSRHSCAEEQGSFGLCDVSPSVLAVQRQRARELHQHQINSATLRRRDAQFSRILEQKKEIDMLNRTRQEMRADQMSRHRKLRGMREAVEHIWAQAIEAKRLREQDERNFMKAGGRLMIEQCDQYPRCQQCKRRSSFCGGTNLWKESRYIPGSLLMV